MSLTNTFYSNYSTTSLLQQRKASRTVASGLLVIVVLIHATSAWFLLNTSISEHTKPVVMEVVMLKNPEHIEKEAAKTPPPAPKLEPEKPKPIIKPPIKKPVVKPVPKPVIKPIEEMKPAPLFEPAPAPPVETKPVASPSISNTAPTISSPSEHQTPDTKSVISGVVPLVRVPPKYPARAASRHIQGWVKVEFTIQTDGTVDAPSVVSAEPEGIFDDSAITAILKWKFKEKIINGVAVPQRAVQTLQFKLEQ